MITETWQGCSDSITLKKVKTEGFHCIDATRPLAQDADAQNAMLVNHGVLAVVYRQDIKITKRLINVALTTFEYISGSATVDNNHVQLIDGCRPGTEDVTALFFSELTIVHEQLSTYRCPIVVCGELSINVDVYNDSSAK